MKFKKSEGLALPIILILLLVMTILGVTSLTSSSLQERMTASQRLRSFAFNAAETTLREAERHVALNAETIRGQLLFALEEDLSVNPFWQIGFPSETESNPGNFCTDGYCIPFEFDNRLASETQATSERWLDVDVWETQALGARNYRELQEYTDAELAAQDIGETPRYIVEFLGQVPFRENTDEPEDARTKCEVVNAPNNTYPFCPLDPYYFRVTARAVAGTEGRQAVVMLQSTVYVDLID